MDVKQLLRAPQTTFSFGLRFSLVLSGLIAATLLVYWPGLSGPLLLDAYSNLSQKGDNGGVNNLANLRQFVFGNTSGPTGRPIAMLSFLIDGQDWPLHVASFKYTNLLIHVLNGLLLCWLVNVLFCHLLLSSTQAPAQPSAASSSSPALTPQNQAAVLALLVAAFWLLHPLNVSTTLYVIQRMTQLMTLFPFGLLAVLSKENGALLLLLIAIFELSIFRTSPSNGRFKLWYRVGVLFPLLIIFIYPLLDFPASLAGYEFRHFSMVERLLTESRILCIYLFKLFIPNTLNAGLLHDDFLLSTSLFQPYTTLMAVCFLSALIAGALRARKNHPLFFFGVC